LFRFGNTAIRLTASSVVHRFTVWNVSALQI